MSKIYKFTATGTNVQRYEFQDGHWKPEDTHHNQTISIDPSNLDVKVTTTFQTFTQDETFSLTPETNDDPTFYVRTSNVFTGGSGGGCGGDSGGGSGDDTYKFLIDGTSVQRFEFDDGDWHPEDLHRNQTVSADPATNIVTITSAFPMFTEVETFSPTLSKTDEDWRYVRTSRVFTALDGTPLPTDPRDASHDQILTGTDQKDQFDGSIGNDHMSGGNGDDTLNGGEGDDDLIGGTGNDIIAGGAGLDVISGDAGSDKLGGGADDDMISGGEGKDAIDGGAGNDSLDGGPGSDSVKGGVGDDDLTGGDGTDSLVGGDGNDTLLGGIGNDKLDGGKGNDIMLAGQDAGADSLGGGAGEDLVDYSAANTGMTIDLNKGVAVGTTTAADSGTDKLSTIEDVLGSAFADVIIGSKGDNQLNGGEGNDTITGGKGADTLTGGAGNDTFAFVGVSDSDLKKIDKITDFAAGADKIDLSAIDAVKGVGGSAFTLSDTVPIEGHAAGMVWFNAATHTLYASVDDNAKAEIAITLTGVDTIAVTDLVL